MGISTHILDTTLGRPARDVTVRLEQLLASGAKELVKGVTDADGRVKPLLEAIPAAGTYRLHFEVAPYFARLGVEAFYPSVVIDFVVKAAHEHYHVPLLLNPYGYSTYRGS
ncbi:MAG: hydroxyisourate hydrolase [Myxococcus sp.]|nr:hydroxyisourate hydrolase [Myxococcus sp.]